MRRVIACALVCSFAACAYDWEGFARHDADVDASTMAPEVDGAVAPPGEDAASEDGAITPPEDAKVPVDGGGDANADAALPCSPSTACIDTGKACGTACGTASATCVAACANNGCRNQCRNAEIACRDNCAGQCASCTQAAGCASPGACDAAAKTD